MCRFQQTVQQFFKHYGRLVAKWPLLFILCSSLVALILTGGLVIVFIRGSRSSSSSSSITINSDDQFRLFLPENSEAIRDLTRLRSLFPISVRDAYDVFQSSYAYVIVVADQPDGDVLDENVLRALARLIDRIKRIRVKMGWLEATWTTLCARDSTSGRCLEHPLITLLNESAFPVGEESLRAISPFLTYPTTRFANRLIDNSLVFGSVDADPDTGRMLRARAARVPFLLEPGESAERRTLNELWQREFVRLVRATRERGLTIHVSSSISWKEEMDRNGQLLVSYLPALFAVLLIFCVMCCCTDDWVRSQPWLGFCGLLSAIMAVTSSFGVLFYFQYQYLQVVVIMPFLILSVCADNAFLMLSAWRSSSGESNLERRISAAMSQSAVSILITALTDGLSFAVGSASQFPAVRIFCTYCAVAILFAFVYQTTFFAACLTLCGRRELANRHCLTLRHIVPKATKKSLKHHYQDSISHTAGTWLASALDKNAVKVLVVLIYIGYLGSSIYGLTNCQLRLNMSNLVPYDSYVIGERSATDQHFSEYNGYAQAVVLLEEEASANLHRPSELARLIDLYEKLCSTEYSSTGQFWLNDFVQTVRDSDSLDGDDARTFALGVRRFLDQPEFASFKDDVVWSEDSDDSITALRMFVRLRRVGGSNQSTAVKVLRKRFAESKLQGFVTDPIVFLLADQNDSVLGCVLQDAAVATGVIIAVVLIFLPKLLCAVWIGVSILSINVGVLGYLALWHVQVDVISMMTTVMSVGLSVDYVAHVTYHYLIAHHSTSYHRLREALQHAGGASVQSALATALGASTLAFVDSYMVRTFVKTVVLVVTLGLIHGLIFLPVALSAFVPADQYLETNNYAQAVRAYVQATVPRTKRLAGYFGHQQHQQQQEHGEKRLAIEEAPPNDATYKPRRTVDTVHSTSRRSANSGQRPGHRSHLVAPSASTVAPALLECTTASSLPWTSTTSKSLVTSISSSSDSDDHYANSSHEEESPVYDCPPVHDLDPERLSGQMVEIVLKNNRHSPTDCSLEGNAHLRTFLPLGTTMACETDQPTDLTADDL